MKVAIWIVNILAFFAFICFSALMLLGGYHGETQNESKVKIRAEPFKVMYSLTEPDEMKLWMSDLKNVQVLTDDFAHHGSRARLTFDHDGDREVVDAQISTFEPEERLVIDLDCERYSGTSTFLLDYRPPRTYVIQTLELKYKTFWDKLLSPIVEEKTDERVEHDLNELHFRVEHTP